MVDVTEEWMESMRGIGNLIFRDPARYIQRVT